MSTVIIASIVALLLFFAGRGLYKNKKAGKSSCGGNCAGCSGCCSCHKDKEK